MEIMRRTPWLGIREQNSVYKEFVKGMYPTPHIHEHLRNTNGYGKLRTSSRTTWTTRSIANNGTDTTKHTDVYNAQFWARRAPLCWCTCVHTSHLWLRSSPCVSFHIIHACALVFGVLSGLLLTRLSTSSSSSSSSSTWCPSRRLVRSPWKIPCATPAWGAWSLWTMSHPSQVMSPRTWTSQTPMSWTSRPPAISTSRTPWTIQLPLPTFLTSTTMSLPNSLQLWSIEQGNLSSEKQQWSIFLWHPKLEKCSESVSFSHPTWNDLSNWGVCSKQGSLKSAKALKHRLGQCWMNCEERLSLNTVRKFFITNSLQHMPNKIAKFYKEELLRQQQDFREVHQQDLMKQKELQ